VARRAWLMAVVGAFVIWFAVFVAAGCSGTGSKGETWIEHTPPPAAKRDAQTITQLNQKLRLNPPPKYTIDVDSANYAADSTAVTCSQEDVDWCMHVTTAEPYPSAKDLASITRASVIAVDPMLGSHGVRKSCGHPSPSRPPAPSPSPQSTPRGYEPQLCAATP
jgi:hypothetical protein